MTRSPRPRFLVPIRTHCCLLTTSLAWGWIILAVGCQPAKTPVEEKTPPGEGQIVVQPAAEGEPGEAEELLAKMAAAYRQATSYEDAGTVRHLIEPDDEGWSRWSPFSLSVVRPDKIRLTMHELGVVCDGRTLHAWNDQIPGKILEKPAPAELTMPEIYNEQILPPGIKDQMIPEVLPPLVLLLEEEPLEVLLAQAEPPVMDEPGKIGQRQYHRVRAEHPQGTFVFWIDPETYVLRRLIYPTDATKRAMEARSGTELEIVSLVADFEGARLNAEVDPAAFAFEMPEGMKIVDALVPLDPNKLLGKRIGEFTFLDAEGNRITRDSLAGKTVVLEFWATWCQPCREGLPKFQEVYRHYKDNGQVAFLAVSVDAQQIENKVLQERLDEWGVELPIVRDLDENMRNVFEFAGVPATFIIDGKGVLQDFLPGFDPQLPQSLPKKLDRLLAGEDIYPAHATEGGGDRTKTEEFELPKVEIAPRSEPETFQLLSMWKSSDVTSPGNILVVERKDGSPRILVIDGWKSIAEVGLDGKLIARHEPKIDPSEIISALRTATGSDGKRYYVAFALLSAQQRCHLLDENLELLVSYPEDALESPHQGIADVRLADLRGSGEIRAYVGYWGVVGVQEVSLEGKRLAYNRSLADVSQIAVSGPDAQGRRQLLCTNNTGALAVIDAGDVLKLQRQVAVPGRFLRWITAADLTADGRPEWCALGLGQPADNPLIGLDLQGNELWSHDLPPGIHEKPIEQIVSGRLFVGAQGQWLLPGTDGSIHIVAADGKLIDRFNYGAVLTGLATAESDDRPMLIVASENGLEAFSVQQNR